MYYAAVLKPKAVKDCRLIPKKQVKHIFKKIELLQDDLAGDVKKLTDFSHEYRLRVGDYRVLFECEDGVIVIYRILHRKDVYKS